MVSVTFEKMDGIRRQEVFMGIVRDCLPTEMRPHVAPHGVLTPYEYGTVLLQRMREVTEYVTSRLGKPTLQPGLTLAGWQRDPSRSGCGGLALRLESTCLKLVVANDVTHPWAVPVRNQWTLLGPMDVEAPVTQVSQAFSMAQEWLKHHGGSLREV
jgi:hypothetical protein